MVGKNQGYCVKCKAQKEMVDPKSKKTKNGRHMLQSKCGKCGTTISKFVSNKSGGEEVMLVPPSGGEEVMLVPPSGGVDGGKQRRKSRSRSKKGGKSRSRSRKGSKKSKSRSRKR